MGQALSSFVANLCGDTDQDEFQSSTRSSHTHIFPQRPGPQLIQTPLSWSRGSDSFTQPVTNSVTNRIVRNPLLGSDPDGDSSSWTPELSQLSFGLGHLVNREESDSVRQLGRDHALRWPRGSDSFIQPVTNSVTNRIVRNPPPGSDPEGDSSSWTPELSRLSFGLGHHVKRDESDSVRQLGRDHALRWSRGSDSFIQPVSVTNRIVRNPPPGSDPDGDSSLRTREVSQLGHGHHVTRDESDSASQLRRDPAITLPKWLDVSLKDSSITVLEEKKEVVREVSREERERYEERGRGAKVGRVERWMKHYSSFQKILLVGDGDFSFSACLAVAFGCAQNIIATSLDSRGKTNKPRLAKLISENYVKKDLTIGIN